MPGKSASFCVFKNNWVFFLLFLIPVFGLAALPGCLGENEKEDVEDSEPGSDSQEDLICGVSFDEKILPFFESYCLRCHSAGVESPSRNGAPQGLNFDTVNDVLSGTDVIRPVLFDLGGMPPEPPIPSAMERDDIISWLDCAAAESEQEQE